jgi:hypothetical protein
VATVTWSVSLVAEVVAEGYFTLLKSASGETLGVQEQGHLRQGRRRGSAR